MKTPKAKGRLYPVVLAFTLLATGVYFQVRHGMAHGKPLKLLPVEAGFVAALPTLITAASLHLLVLTFEGTKRPGKLHAIVARLGVLGIAAAAFRVSYDAWTAVSKAAGISPNLASILPWITEGFLAFTVYAAWVIRYQDKPEPAEAKPEPPQLGPVPDDFEQWAAEAPTEEPMPEPAIEEPEVTSPSAGQFPAGAETSSGPAPVALRGASNFLALANKATSDRSRDFWMMQAQKHTP
jgi:hypothetical protein